MRTLERLFLVLATVTGLAAISSAVVASTAVQAGSKPFEVTSTLAGKKVLPHRIRWLGLPKLPASKVAEVDFLIDGKVHWIEHNAPYSYGFDGNYLVTSWLRPGLHRFAVRAIANDGHGVGASRTTLARVLPAALPVAKLASTRWKRTLTPAQAGGQPAGTWVLSIDKVGWKIKVPPVGANLIDVGYLSPGLVELRGGVWTRPHPANNPTEGNSWCDEPFQPVRYRWAVDADADSGRPQALRWTEGRPAGHVVSRLTPIRRSPRLLPRPPLPPPGRRSAGA